MSDQSKIDIDNIYLKNIIKDEDPYKRSFGHLYLNPRDVNYKEQIEMSVRTMGKLYDWDFEKFRVSNKSIDRTQKKRFLKNFSRFSKNPFGYIFWKGYHRFNVPRFIVFALSLSVFVEFYQGIVESREKGKSINYFITQGQNLNGTGTQYVGYNDRVMPYQKSIFFSLIYSLPDPNYFVTNPADIQNLRLHLEMGKKYGKL